MTSLRAFVSSRLSHVSLCAVVVLAAAGTLVARAARANPPLAHTASVSASPHVPAAPGAAARASSAVAAAGGTTVPSGSPGPGAVPEGVVNVNAATEDELVRLPGVGPARAHAIVQLRERVHQFGHPEDLLRVRGIGRVGFRRLRPYVSLAGPTTLAARPGRAPSRAGHRGSDPDAERSSPP